MNGIAKLLPRHVKARVEIIPLIDVIFFLLATFVLFTLSLNKLVSLPLELPDTTHPDVVPSHPLTIRVSDGGGILWEQDVIDRAELPSRLAQLRQTEKDPRIMIAGDQTVSFGAAVEVLDEVHMAGVIKVTLDLTGRANRR